MAIRDHTLDEKIIEAATREFLEHGFQHASLRKIATRAGITTGALYTRYRNKDVLFASLVESILEEMRQSWEPMSRVYQRAKNDPEKILRAIRQEEGIYLELLFRHYDQCILFFCRSEGSSVRRALDARMTEKARETARYFRDMARNEAELQGIEFILSEQMHYFRQILDRGLTRDRAMACMKTVERFLEAGWQALFREMTETTADPAESEETEEKL